MKKLKIVFGQRFCKSHILFTKITAMRRSLIFCLLTVFCTSIYSQVVIDWKRCLGGSDIDNGYEIEATIDGGYIVAGYSYSNDGDVSSNIGGSDVWVAKLDASGSIQWEQNYGGSYADMAHAIQQTSDGGYIIVGQTLSTDSNVTGHNGLWDVWLLKLTATGSIQWAECFGGSSHDVGWSVDETIDGGYIVAGETESNDGDVAGHHGNPDGWVIKVDGNGNLQWQRCLGGASWDYAYSVQQTADTGYIVACATGSWDGDVSNHIGAVHNNDYWLVKLDLMGNIEWEKCYGGSEHESPSSIQQTLDGGYIMAGSSKSTDYDVTINYGNYDMWVLKVSDTGRIEWETSLGGSEYEGCTVVRQTDDGGYIIGGQTYSDDHDVTVNYGYYDCWMVKLSSAGQKEWQQSFGGSDDDLIFDLHETAPGHYIIAAGTQSNDTNVIGNHGSSDIWIVKVEHHFNAVTGKVYFDFNKNGIQDPGDLALKNHKVYESIIDRVTFTNDQGEYNLVIPDTGNFSVGAYNINSYASVPNNYMGHFDTFAQIEPLKDFAFQPETTIDDLRVIISPINLFRPGRLSTYYIHYYNVGTTVMNNVDVVFDPDGYVKYDTSFTLPTFITTDSVVWTIPILSPFQSGRIIVKVEVDPGTMAGTIINSVAKIFPIASDGHPEDNIANWEVESVASHDPNDIMVSRDSLLFDEVLDSPYLDYLIRFQNTGNDTAFDVKVLNAWPAGVDFATFEFVESSHPVQLRFENDKNILWFEFANILLPDSNVNEQLSHGFIRYRTRSDSTLMIGDSVKNSVAIFFDYNAPVWTNTAVTEVVMPVGIEPTQVNPSVFLYPNPVTNSILYFVNPFVGEDRVLVRIYDLIGHCVYQEYQSGVYLKSKVDVSDLPDGLFVIAVAAGDTTYQTGFVRR